MRNFKTSIHILSQVIYKMSGGRLKFSNLLVFVQFYTELNEDKLLTLCIISRRLAHAVASQREIDSIELQICYSYNQDTNENTTILTSWLKSRNSFKTTRHFLTSPGGLMTAIVCLKLLFHRRTKLGIVVYLCPSDSPIPWFKEDVAVKTGRIIKEFFPRAKLKLRSTASMKPASYQQLKPFILQLVPALRNVECCPPELELLQEADLNVLKLSEYWNYPRSSWFYPSLLSVTAKELILGPQFPLENFLYGSYPTQTKAAILICGIDPEKDESSIFYRDIFKEISTCLPNLKLLKCNTDQFGIQCADGEDPTKLIDGKMARYYIKAIEKAAWHIREVCQHSHIKTKVNVKLDLNTHHYVEASARLFSELLVGSRIKQHIDEIEDGLIERFLAYKQRKTYVNIRIFGSVEDDENEE